jgi:hypothetical protein
MMDLNDDFPIPHDGRNLEICFLGEGFLLGDLRIRVPQL